MRQLFSFLLFFTASLNLLSQSTILFKWVNGVDTLNQTGTYGTKGVASANNIPGARENSITWVDNSSNLWLLGGHGYSAYSTQGYLNDLWKYDTLSMQWTWMSGTDTINKTGSYGTLMSASAYNYPGSRQNSVTWKDNSGNLWLFGGNGFASVGGLDFLNDLWKYDITSNEWTWMSGSKNPDQVGSYGTQGVPSANNIPGARFGSLAWFENNHLWLFGGQGNISNNQVRFNDLWKYDIATNMWTWVSGSNTTDQNGTYGAKTVASVSNIPGARQASAAWTDNSNNFWLFGGYGFPASGNHSYLNDLWRYNVSTSEWTWMSGTDTINQPAIYGTKGVAFPNNISGGRQMSIPWKDKSGDLWMFGGWGYIGPPFGRLNDLWKYNIASNQWTWIGGTNLKDQNGIYGTQSVSSASNIPGARRMSISWTDKTGNFWLFGGNGYDKLGNLGLLNDLWQITFSTATGISDEFNNEYFNIYPNPFFSFTTLQADNKIKDATLTLYNLYGQQIKEIKNISGQTVVLSRDNLASGLYFLRLTQDKVIATKKLIITD